ncbi:MAG: M48 family metallopeptidase [Patescibacteria group bacterium]
MPTRADYLKHKKAARAVILERLEYFNRIYKFPFERVAIRNQKTRWGSCSRKRNLNFNFKMIFLPQYLIDYIVVHELCHLKQMNHSKQFWDLVAQVIPDYRARKKELEKTGRLL